MVRQRLKRLDWFGMDRNVLDGCGVVSNSFKDLGRMERFELIQNGLKWFAMLQNGLEQFGIVWNSLEQFGMVWNGMDWVGMILIYFERFRMVWNSQHWFRMDWDGLEWLERFEMAGMVQNGLMDQMVF